MTFPLYTNKKNLWVLVIDGNRVNSNSDIEKLVYSSFSKWFGGSLSDMLKSNHRAGFADNISISESGITPLKWDSATVANRATSDFPTLPMLPAGSKAIYVKVSFDYRGPSQKGEGWPIDINVILDTIQSPIDDSLPPNDDTILTDVGNTIGKSLSLPLLGIGVVFGLYLLAKSRR